MIAALRKPDLDWTHAALTGDIGAVPVPPVVTVNLRWRPGKVSILIFVAWLAWEAAGLVRALTIGPPILEAIWSLRP